MIRFVLQNDHSNKGAERKDAGAEAGRPSRSYRQSCEGEVKANRPEEGWHSRQCKSGSNEFTTLLTTFSGSL